MSEKGGVAERPSLVPGDGDPEVVLDKGGGKLQVRLPNGFEAEGATFVGTTANFGNAFEMRVNRGGGEAVLDTALIVFGLDGVAYNAGYVVSGGDRPVTAQDLFVKYNDRLQSENKK